MPVYLDTRGNSVLSVVICDRCSRKFAYTELMPDPNFPGMRVCKDDLDNFDPWRLPARQTENISLRFPRPDISVALPLNLIDTEGAPNTTVQYNELYIEGAPYGQAGAPGNLNTQSNYQSQPPPVMPSIGALIPNNGTHTGGTPVIINGNNFTSISTVTFGGVNALFSLISSTQISAVTPAHAIGVVDVRVLGPFGIATAPGAFTYT